jgi:hypothetical protein
MGADTRLRAQAGPRERPKGQDADVGRKRPPRCTRP